jgi:predicted nucleic acid-binding protein
MDSGLPLFISVQTAAEIIAGADKDNWGKPRRAALQEYLETQFTTFPIDENTEPFYVAMLNGSARLGKALKIADNWIVATAKQYDLVLVTHDGEMRVGEDLGVKLICRK